MREAGFTLIELMITIVVVAILAGIGVVAYEKVTDSAHADAEVARLFTELSMREDQYYAENGTYLSTGTGEDDKWPAAPASEGGPNALTPLPATWQALAVNPDSGSAYCSYVVIAGAAGDPSNLGAKAADFGLTTAPAKDWFYVLAECDFDGDSTLNSFYFKRSSASVTQSENEGK